MLGRYGRNTVLVLRPRDSASLRIAEDATRLRGGESPSDGPSGAVRAGIPRACPVAQGGEAIDERFLELRSESPPDVTTLIRRIFEQYPDPADLPPREYDVHDRRAARATRSTERQWLAKYADHDPDWADGCLAVFSGRDKSLKVWTCDREFRTTWRRPNGTTIPLAVPLT